MQYRLFVKVILSRPGGFLAQVIGETRGITRILNYVKLRNEEKKWEACIFVDLKKLRRDFLSHFFDGLNYG